MNEDSLGALLLDFTVTPTSSSMRCSTAIPNETSVNQHCTLWTPMFTQHACPVLLYHLASHALLDCWDYQMSRTNTKVPVERWTKYWTHRKDIGNTGRCLFFHGHLRCPWQARSSRPCRHPLDLCRIELLGLRMFSSIYLELQLPSLLVHSPFSCQICISIFEMDRVARCYSDAGRLNVFLNEKSVSRSIFVSPEDPITAH